jgi:hypothetical protein
MTIPAGAVMLRERWRGAVALVIGVLVAETLALPSACWASAGSSVGKYAARSGGSILVLVLVIVVVIVLIPLIVAYWLWRRARVEVVAVAAHTVGHGKKELSPRQIEREVRLLFLEIQKAWSADDRAALYQMVGPDLMREWTIKLDEWRERWVHNEVLVTDGPKVEYLGFRRRPTERILVRVEATMRDSLVDRQGHRVAHSESAKSGLRNDVEVWTLERRSDRWVLMEVDTGLAGVADTFRLLPESG